VGGSENIVVDQQVGESSTSREVDDISSNSGAMPDMLQSPVSGSIQSHQSEPAGVEPLTPQNSASTWGGSTPSSGSSSRPVRYRNLNDVYSETVEIELVDSEDELEDADVQALLVETGEPTCFREAVGHKEWIDAMDMEMESIEKNKT
jgi:hypothetical protein